MTDTLWRLFADLHPGPEAGVCPLCGRRSTRLTPCPGCGWEAWTGPFLAQHGEDAVATLRTALGTALGECSADVEDGAAAWAYQPGGCRLCPACRGQTQVPGASWRCPLFLLSERTLDGEGCTPTAYLPALWRGESWTTWGEELRGLWCASLEPGPARWRRAILDAALAPTSHKEALP